MDSVATTISVPEIVKREIVEKDDGTKEIITFSIDPATNLKHKTVQIVKQMVFIERKSSSIDQRHSTWKKYGKEALNTSLEKCCIVDNVNFMIGEKYLESKKLEESSKKDESKGGSVRKCDFCGGNHMKLSCPVRKQMRQEQKMKEQQQMQVEGESKNVSKDGSEIPTWELYNNKNTFITSKLRERLNKNQELIEQGNEPLSQFQFEKLEEDKKTLFISNLNLNVTEEDIRRELFPSNGFTMDKIERVNLVKNKITGASRGIAYVVVLDDEVAEACAEQMNGKGFMSTIINVETLASKNTKKF
ncbi:hypothetical protein QEN19_001651 [Hanseniaspora menglaensis]